MTDAQAIAIIAAIFRASPKSKKQREPEEQIAAAYVLLQMAKQYTQRGNA
jgi:hypothetical protein